MLLRDTFVRLTDRAAIFSTCGDPKQWQHDLNAGFAPAGPPHLLVRWNHPWSEPERQRLIARIAALPSVLMRAYVLTYHSGNVAGNDYATNNLVALAHDLAQLRALGVPVVPLRDIVAALLAHDAGRLPEPVVALTLDDGLDFDFVELVHPFHGAQPSVRTVLERHERAYGERMHATSFVIASPDARRQIAAREMLGYAWIGEHWWAAAVASGRFDIGNHGWDHVSPSVTTTAEPDGRAGSFRHVDTFEEADLQVRVAREYIAARAPNPAPPSSRTRMATRAPTRRTTTCRATSSTTARSPRSPGGPLRSTRKATGGGSRATPAAWTGGRPPSSRGSSATRA